MASVVEICNMALDAIGKATINGLDEAITEAEVCKRHYGQALNTVLQAYPWRHANVIQALPETTNDRSDVWGFAYTRPQNCLKICRIGPSPQYLRASKDGIRERGAPFEQVGKSIYCDVSPAYVEMTSIPSDTLRFPPLFIDALAANLQYRIAMPLTRDPKLRADALTLYRQLLAAASAADANENPGTTDFVSDFELARGD